MNKSSSSKDSSDIHNLRSTDVSGKATSENALASSCMDASSSDKPTATGKARSSPLRRLLEPLLKRRQKTAGACYGQEAWTTNYISGSLEWHCIYTFFTIREVKKKYGSWINQGGKGKAHDYIHNAVAQMKADNQTSVFQPNDELAAVVVKIPKKIIPSSRKHEHQNNNSSKMSQVNLKESLSGVSCKSNSGENVQSQLYLSSQNFVSTTVILPGGTHSLPSKGGPSSLIERWNTGGSCDCGGWDLGCKLRILANQNQAPKKSSSTNGSPTADRLELFSEGGAQESQLLFSLAPFKDGVYSVEFSSSLSTLQAFSICIAVLDSRNLRELSEPFNSLEEKSLGQTMHGLQNSGVSGTSRTEGDVPRYVSYPPLSPVGRV
ncbi:hypothetical protein FNV43_RR13201 [Rhamnella rubrinervis]|uniref:Uncharacterized protein n=1 Tax=Rhamnella rubrinervis TaxID=2594499 RepID=A0A8K0H0N4_9ROSA|nr:hypothetical protein FNV43_RR13201 [Rhamnella rubrinervis]